MPAIGRVNSSDRVMQILDQRQWTTVPPRGRIFLEGIPVYNRTENPVRVSDIYVDDEGSQRIDANLRLSSVSNAIDDLHTTHSIEVIQSPNNPRLIDLRVIEVSRSIHRRANPPQ